MYIPILLGLEVFSSSEKSNLSPSLEVKSYPQNGHKTGLLAMTLSQLGHLSGRGLINF